MSKTVKIWLIVALALVVAGLVICCAGMMAIDWDFTKLVTYSYEDNEYVLNEKFENIYVKTSEADISFLKSENGETKVLCHEKSGEKHSVKVSNGTLVIEISDQKWYKKIGINFGIPKLMVYLPESEYNELIVNVSTGDVALPENTSFKNVDVSGSTGDIISYSLNAETVKFKLSTGKISVNEMRTNSICANADTGDIDFTDVVCMGDISLGVSTGKTRLNGVNCRSLVSIGGTGDISLESVIATEKLDIKRSTGDVSFKGSDANAIFVKTSTGDVCGSLLSDKVYITNTSTGNINVPNSIVGGRCEITTSTGDIKITVN